MPVTGCKLDCINATNLQVSEAALNLRTLAGIPYKLIADVFGYHPSHALEWEHAAALEPHSEAYAPAWIHLVLTLWAVNAAAGITAWTPGQPATGTSADAIAWGPWPGSL